MFKDAQKAVALGFFDGVHRGHAVIIGETLKLAQALSLTPSALSFTESPKGGRGGPPPSLTSVARRHSLMRGMGIVEILPLPFDEKMRNTSAQSFVEDILYKQYNCRACVCGKSFRFGKGAGGDTALLTALCAELGIAVSVCEEIADEGDVVSSTLIRRLLLDGELARANRLLQAPFVLEGAIEGGRLSPGKGLLVPGAGRYRGQMGGAQVSLLIDGSGAVFLEAFDRPHAEVLLLERLL